MARPSEWGRQPHTRDTGRAFNGPSGVSASTYTKTKEDENGMNRLTINEPRVYRRIAFPVSAFDVLCGLKRKWGMETSGEVITRVLLSAGKTLLMETGDGDRHQERTHV